MSTYLIWLQLVLVVLVVAVNLVTEVGLTRWGQRLLAKVHRLRTGKAGEVTEGQEGVAPACLPWYWTTPVETGILEVALAMTAAALALPAFVQPAETVHAWVIGSLQVILLIAATLAAVSTLWLYRIYVCQLRTRVPRSDDPGFDAPAGGKVFWAWGPYSLLAWVLICLLLGFGALTYIAVTGRSAV